MIRQNCKNSFSKFKNFHYILILQWDTMCFAKIILHVRTNKLMHCKSSKLTEGLRERTEHLDIFLFTAHHSVLFPMFCLLVD